MTTPSGKPEPQPSAPNSQQHEPPAKRPATHNDSAAKHNKPNMTKTREKIMTLGEDHGLTAADLIEALSSMPGDALVVIEAEGATEHLMIVTSAEDGHTYEELDQQGDTVVVPDGRRCLVLSAVEATYLVEHELGEFAADLADL